MLWIKRTNFLRPHIRSDNAPEFTAKAVREWLELVGVKTLFIEPGMRKRVDVLLFYRHVYLLMGCCLSPVLIPLFELRKL